MRDREPNWRWWDAKTDHQMAQDLYDVARALENDQGDRYERYRDHLRLYGGVEYAGLRPGEFSPVDPRDRVSINVVQSTADTYVAKIVKNQVSVRFETDNASYDDRKKAQKLSAACPGLLEMMEARKLAPKTEADTAIVGTGIAVVRRCKTHVTAERVMPWELLIDDVDGYYGRPRNAYLCRYVEKDVLLAKYGKTPELKRLIQNAEKASQTRWGYSVSSYTEPVMVIEAWHLGTDGQPGVHCIAIQEAMLECDKKWMRSRLPIVARRWQEPPIGWHGIGIAERLFGIQIEINKLLWRIQQAHKHFARTFVVLDEASGIPKAHITNDMAAILVNHGGTAPQVMAPPTFPQDVYLHLQWLIRQAYEEIGISQLSATSKKPGGLESGIALREYHDIETERFAQQGMRYEDWHVDLIYAALEEIEHGGEVTIRVRDQSEYTIKPEDAKAARERYTIRAFPTSALPQSPAGRLQHVVDIANTGWIDPDDALDLLGWPDLDDFRSERSAQRDLLRMKIGNLLEGKPFAENRPEPIDNLEQAMLLVPKWYARARVEGCPADRLQNIRNFLVETNRLAQAAMPPPPPAPEQAAALGPPMPGQEAVPTEVAPPPAV